jgi:hypothetical protein
MRGESWFDPQNCFFEEEAICKFISVHPGLIGKQAYRYSVNLRLICNLFIHTRDTFEVKGKTTFVFVLADTKQKHCAK